MRWIPLSVIRKGGRTCYANDYLDYRERYGLETRIVRMHDVYGPLAIWTGGNETSVAGLRPQSGCNPA